MGYENRRIDLANMRLSVVFIKETFAGILIVTGPITFGLSVLPAWKDAWIQWVARYVSVLLYGFIGFLY